MEAEFENGFAVVGDGEWIVPAGQPAAVKGELMTQPVRGGTDGGWWRRFIAPDRRRLVLCRLKGRMWCAAAERPFLTRIDLGERVNVVTGKLLLAAAAARRGGRLVRVIPFSLRSALCATELEIGWALCGTTSRVTKIVVEEGETVGVRPEAVVAWTGHAPTGFCPRLRMRDLVLPRMPKCLRLDFHGPAIVWIEGTAARRVGMKGGRVD